MGLFYDRAAMRVSGTPGTGPVTLSTAYPGYRTFAAAGVPDATLVAYAIEDGSNWEVGKGTYSSTGPTLTRTTIYCSSNSNAAINASTSAVVFITFTAENVFDTTTVLPVAGGGTGTASPSLVQGSNVTITGAWPNQTISSSGGITSLTIGSTPITSGTTGRLLYDNSALVGEALLTYSAANLQLGAADAAAPVAQTFQVQSVVAGTSNIAGANFTINGSVGTGTGAGGSIIFNVVPAGTTGTSQNALAEALKISADSNRTMTFWSGIGAGTAVLLSTPGYFQFAAQGVSPALSVGGSSISPASAAFSLGTASVGYSLLALASNFNTGITLVYSDAANVLAQRNSTSAQTFNIYNTYTDASNYERVALTWSSNVAYLRAQNAGTGSARIFVPVTGSTTVASLPAAATAGSGARSFVTDATATTFLSTVAGGGANKVPVVSDGTNWLIG